jgi:hypothetical protein
MANQRKSGLMKLHGSARWHGQGPVWAILLLRCAACDWLFHIRLSNDTKAFEAADRILNGFTELLIMTWAKLPSLGLLTAAT